MTAVSGAKTAKRPTAAGNDGEPVFDPLRRLPEGDGMISLTFDDGPDPRFTPQLLDLLAIAGVPATFFVIADKALQYPDIVRRMMHDGHSVASHGWSHRHPWFQSPSSARRQVVIANHALTSLLGSAPRWFRPPYGRVRSSMTQAAVEAGQRVVLWSKSAVDWGPWATPRRVMRRLRAVEGGDIVLMHDGRNRHNRPEVTLEALPELLALLTDRQLRPVPLYD